MSTPFYIKETKLEQVSNARISDGCALLFYLDGKLKMKFPDGSIKDASGGSDVGRFVIARPISDQTLYPKVEASSTSSFEDVISIDPLHNADDRKYLQVFDGSNWVDFVADGLGTPFDRMEVSVDVSKFANLQQPYYIRYCWMTSDGVESNFRSSLFPSVSIGSSSSGSSSSVVTIGDNGNWFIDGVDTGKKATGMGSNVVLSPTQPADPYDGMIWIQTSEGEEEQYVNFETINVVRGTEIPENAPNGTIFIQE